MGVLRVIALLRAAFSGLHKGEGENSLSEVNVNSLGWRVGYTTKPSLISTEIHPNSSVSPGGQGDAVRMKPPFLPPFTNRGSQGLLGLCLNGPVCEDQREAY